MELFRLSYAILISKVVGGSVSGGMGVDDGVKETV